MTQLTQRVVEMTDEMFQTLTTPEQLELLGSFTAERQAANNTSVKARNKANPVRDKTSCFVTFDQTNNP